MSSGIFAKAAITKVASDPNDFSRFVSNTTAIDPSTYTIDSEYAFTAKFIEFTQDYVAANTDSDGNVSISVTFEHLTYGTYTITKTVQAEEWEIVSVDAENGTVKQTVVTEFEINSSNVSEDSNIVLAATYADSYEPKMTITVTKKIDTKSLEFSTADSSFTFTLERSDGETYTQTATIPVSTDPDTADADGYVSVSVTFEDLKYGYTYTLIESDIPDGWAFVSASSIGGTVSDGDVVTYGPITKANAKDTYTADYINELILGTITVIKYGNANNLLDGVEYTLYDSDGNVKATGTTGDDGDGTVVFKDLPKGTYLLTETATIDGYSLLADTIEIEIPMVLTQEDLDAYAAAGEIIDTTDALYRRGVYTFTDVTYEITDTANLRLPTTGDTGRIRKVLLAVFAGLILIAAISVGVSLKKEHGQAAEEPDRPEDPDSPDGPDGAGEIPEEPGTGDEEALPEDSTAGETGE